MAKVYSDPIVQANAMLSAATQALADAFTQAADVVAEETRATTIVSPLTVNVPESHWARVEDVDAWEAEVTAGPLAASLPAARAFLTQHAPPELVQMLEQTGYGSNPYVIQFVADLAAKFHTDGAR